MGACATKEPSEPAVGGACCEGTALELREKALAAAKKEREHPGHRPRLHQPEDFSTLHSRRARWRPPWGQGGGSPLGPAGRVLCSGAYRIEVGGQPEQSEPLMRSSPVLDHHPTTPHAILRGPPCGHRRPPSPWSRGPAHDIPQCHAHQRCTCMDITQTWAQLSAEDGATMSVEVCCGSL